MALLVAESRHCFFFLLFAQGREPAAVVDRLSSDSITEIDIHGGSLIEFNVANGNADVDTGRPIYGVARVGLSEIPLPVYSVGSEVLGSLR